jgi:hypothetical protein
MSTAITYFCAPQFNTEHLERLAVERSPEIGNQVWTEVHEEVQRILGRLDELVRTRVTHLHTMSGRTQGRGFDLFTYLKFSRTDASELDPVVVGLTFSHADGEERRWVVIDADVSGEQTGDGIEVPAQRRVPASREDLLRAASEMALRLSCGEQRIAEALLDSSRRT